MPVPDIAAALSNYADGLVSSPRDILAHLAAVVGATLVVAGAFVRTMIPLRWLAVGGNLGVLVFGALHPQPVTFCVAAVLLPINLYRAREMMRLTRQVKASQAASDLTGLWLKPYMKTWRLKAGQTLFTQGDLADRLFLLVEGRMALLGVDHEVEPGRIFGEIALFSPDKRRTRTARCISDCTVLTIDEDTVLQLFHQNPSFGFHLMGLVTRRLLDDLKRTR